IAAPSGRLDATFFDGHPSANGGFSAKFFERLGLDDGAEIPAAMAPAIAHGLQRAVEDTVLAMAGEGENLCVAGGLFYNALLVEFLERSGRWKKSRRFWKTKLRFQYQQSIDDVLAKAVRMLGERKIVAWMQGRMEFGPRALGNRSILASPLDPYSTENLNVFIKHREPFRKFAASVPAELAAEYFDAGPNARNLATVGRVKTEHRKTFASAILGDDIVRVHAVTEADNPLYHRLLHEAGKATGLPVLYNTSFNLFGDPMVSTPRDAVRSFYSSGIDALFVGSFVIEK